MPAKETKVDTSAKEDKANDPKSPHPPSWPDADNKDSEEEWKCEQCKDDQLLDKNFSAWHTHMIREGCAGWEKCDTMTCNHGDPCKELRYPDPVGPPLDYMKHHGVFKAEKYNEYDLCHFYHIELSGDLPTFPSPPEPATREMLEDFLLKAQALGHPNLVVAFVGDSAMAVCLLQELHSKDSGHGDKARCGREGYKEAVILPTLSVQWQQQPVVHEPHHVQTLQCQLPLWAVPKRGVHHGSAAEKPSEDLHGFPKAGTPSSSEKEPMPQGSQESS